MINSVDSITVDFSNSGDKLTLTHNTTHFLGYTPTDFICITYLELYDDNCYQCVNSEYYLASEWEMATEAFFERLKNNPIKESSFARNLSEFAKTLTNKTIGESI